MYCSPGLFLSEDCGWYHFSKWESASAAWVIHLGSSDNFLWNMCVLFIPEGIPQHIRRDEYLWKGNKPGEQFVIKEILWKCIHKPLCGLINSLSLLCNYQHNHIMFHRRELRCSQSACSIKIPSYKKCTFTQHLFWGGSFAPWSLDTRLCTHICASVRV